MPHLRRLQLTDDALTLARRVIHDNLDRLHALDRATTRRATPPHELGKLGAQLIVKRLVKAHPHQVALARSQPEPTVTENRDVDAPADQPSIAIGATQATAPISAWCVPGTRRNVGTRHPGRIAASVRRQSAQNNRDTQDGLLLRPARGAPKDTDVANRKNSGVAFPGRRDPPATPTWAKSAAILAQW